MANHASAKKRSRQNKLRNAVNRGDKSEGYAHSMRYSIENSRWGLVSYFGGKDITKIKTLH